MEAVVTRPNSIQWDATKQDASQLKKHLGRITVTGSWTVSTTSSCVILELGRVPTQTFTTGRSILLGRVPTQTYYGSWTTLKVVGTSRSSKRDAVTLRPNSQHNSTHDRCNYIVIWITALENCLGIWKIALENCLFEGRSRPSSRVPTQGSHPTHPTHPTKKNNNSSVKFMERSYS